MTNISLYILCFTVFDNVIFLPKHVKLLYVHFEKQGLFTKIHVVMYHSSLQYILWIVMYHVILWLFRSESKWYNTMNLLNINKTVTSYYNTDYFRLRFEFVIPEIVGNFVKSGIKVITFGTKCQGVVGTWIFIQNTVTQVDVM